MNGVERIAKERQRQIEQKGWTPGHDDEHDLGELTKAAQAYLCEEDHFWPNEWCVSGFKLSRSRIRNLEKAGALIAAEIDRLLRVQEAL